MRKAAQRPTLELADIIRRHGPAYRARGGVPAHHLRTLSAIERCRTAKLGGHMNVCTDCGSTKISYNSCRNRHCPKCGGLARELWINDRRRELLPVRYQHLVFTLPHELNEWCRYNTRLCYDLLFRTAWRTLKKFGRDPRWLGADVGATMVLHTWGQNLSLHPHVHFIVPSGGLDSDKWVRPKRSGKSGFLFPVKAMSKFFRGRFLTALVEAWHEGKLVRPPQLTLPGGDLKGWCRPLWKKPWVVYAKAPFKGPDTVVEYLGRYTHKVAISNHRLVKLDGSGVVFRYKDYRSGGGKKTMCLRGVEFLRRFCQHILPPGFVRMRHYGILSNARKGQALAAVRRALGQPEPEPKAPRKERVRDLIEKIIGHAIDDCPDCGARASLVRILLPANSRAPPLAPGA